MIKKCDQYFNNKVVKEQIIQRWLLFVQPKLYTNCRYYGIHNGPEFETILPKSICAYMSYEQRNLSNIMGSNLCNTYVTFEGPLRLWPENY